MSSLSISVNLNALTSKREVNRGSQSVNDTLEEISSDLSVSEPSGDGLSLSRSSSSRLRGSTGGFKALQKGISRLQAAERGTETVRESLEEIRGHAADATAKDLSSADRSRLQEVVEKELNRLEEAVKSVRFQGDNLLEGNGSSARELTLSPGVESGRAVRIQLNDLSSSSLGVESLDLSTPQNASDALQTVSEAINQVSTQQADITRAQEELQSALDFAQIQRENESASRSRIRDADRALNAASRARAGIESTAGTSALAQAENLQGSSALQLLG